MKRARLWAALLVAWLSCSVSPASRAEAQVRVTADGGRILVVAEIATNVDRELAWQVLTDYGRWAEFIPDLTVSRVVSAPGEPLRLEQRGQMPWLPNLPLVMIVRVEETPPTGIEFLRVAGNVRTFVGEWRIVGRNRVRLVYRSLIEPGFAVPPEVSIEIFRHDAKMRMEAMAREMARRAAGESGARTR